HLRQDRRLHPLGRNRLRLRARPRDRLQPALAPPSAPGALGEALEADLPTLGRADCVAHLLPALAVAVEVAVLELDARSARDFGHEAHLDLAGALRIGLELPLQADVPADDEAVGRFVHE